MEDMRRSTLAAAASLLAVLLVGCTGPELTSTADTSSQPPATSAATNPELPASPTEAPASSDPAAAPPSATSPFASAPSPGTAAPDSASAVVIHVVDDDTIDVQTAAGESGRIRIIGIDTPNAASVTSGRRPT
jgi:endonuclease YncB( thermonuclease family)